MLCVLSACTGSGAGTTGAATHSPAADPLADIARRDGTVVVIVQLAVPQQPDGSWSAAAIAKAERKLKAALGPGARVVERFGRKLPEIVLRVDEAALTELRQSPLVVDISLNAADEATE